MSKYAFISDIHSNIIALKAVIDDIMKKEIPMENIYCLGDLVGYGPNSNEVIDFIIKNKIKTIMGNYDEAVGFYLPSCGCKLNSEKEKYWMYNSLRISSKITTEKNKAFLRELDEELELNINGYSILLVHGSPFSIVEYVYQDSIEAQQNIIDELDMDIVVLGHTHLPYIKKIDNTIFVNAGSVGRPKDKDNRASYIIADFKDEVTFKIVRVEYDIYEMNKRIKESEFLNVFGEMLLCGCTDCDILNTEKEVITKYRCNLSQYKKQDR